MQLWGEKDGYCKPQILVHATTTGPCFQYTHKVVYIVNKVYTVNKVAYTINKVAYTVKKIAYTVNKASCGL